MATDDRASSSKITGSCLCGAVSIQIPNIKKALRTMSCHCIHCRKNAGGPCQTNAVFKVADLCISDDSGKLVRYTFPAAEVQSGHAKEKWFCSVCGCTIFMKPMKHKGDVIVVKTGILGGNGREKLAPAAEYFTRDREPYMGALANTEQFETMP